MQHRCDMTTDMLEISKGFGILIPPFQAALINWVPESLADDLYANGERSWPDVKHLLQIV